MEKVIIGFLVTCFAGIMLCGVDIATSWYGAPVTVVVVEKYYTPSSTSTGFGVSANGESVITTTSKLGEYTLFVATPDKVIHEATTERAMFVRTKIGDTVRVAPTKGGLSGLQYGIIQIQ